MTIAAWAGVRYRRLPAVFAAGEVPRAAERGCPGKNHCSVATPASEESADATDWVVVLRALVDVVGARWLDVVEMNRSETVMTIQIDPVARMRPLPETMMRSIVNIFY